jgi:hypothetical protein
MSLLSDSINALASNVFGGTDISVSLRKSPIELQDNSPLSTLEGDPFAFSSISYPRDVTMDMQNGHYMLFYINVQNKTRYKYEDVETGLPIGEELLTGVKGQAATAENEAIPDTLTTTKTSYGDIDARYRKGIIDRGGSGNIITNDRTVLRKGRKGIGGFENIRPTTTRITDSIAIYLPPNVTNNTGVTYNNAELGIIGAAAAGGAQAIDALRRGDMSKLASTMGTAAKDLLKEGALNLGSEFIGTISGVDPEGLKGFAKKAFGQASNPYMEVLFEGVEMRTFSYNFTFSPRNADETLDVQKIIKMFRFHMLPEMNSGDLRFMTLPSTFDIHYMYQMSKDTATENNFYHKIATCVLKGCEVDYSPGGVKSFASGAPTQITMNLTFQETEMLTKQHVNRGY